MVRKTYRRKTHRRKSHTKRKTSSRHRKGGRMNLSRNGNMVNRGNMGNGNNNNGNNNNDGGIGDFINKLQDVMEEVNVNEQKEIFIDRILELLSEAREIDNRMPGSGMEQQVVQKIADILIQYDPNLNGRNYNALCNNVRRNYIPNN